MPEDCRERNKLGWLGRLICLAALLIPFAVTAAIAGKRIVDEAIDASDADVMRLELKFVMPVNYLWHFPRTDKDDEFLIAVQPIQVLSDYDTDIREHIRIPPELRNIITDLYYDGTEASSRFIVLKTNRNVGITVKLGAGGRSMIVEFHSIAPVPASDCDGKPKVEAK